MILFIKINSEMDFFYVIMSDTVKAAVREQLHAWENNNMSVRNPS